MLESKPKLSFIVPSLTGGGAERSMAKLANELSAFGFPVDFLVLQKGGEFEKLLNSKVNLISLNVARALSAPGPIGAYLDQESPYVIFSALEHMNVAVYRAWKGNRRKTKFVPTIRNHISREAEKAGIVKKIELKWASVAYKIATHVVAVSEGVAGDAERTLGLPSGLVKVIYNPVINQDLEKLALLPPDHPWLLQKDVPTILGVGRLNPQKDWPTLIKACSIVRESKLVRLVILGEGELRSDLERQISEIGAEDWISLPGFCENPFAAMANCSLFVLSSRFEGLPGVLIQALACGSPVVSTDCPSGPHEILQGGKYGRLVPVGNEMALAQAILTSLEEPIRVNQDVMMPFKSSFSAKRYVDLIGLSV